MQKVQVTFCGKGEANSGTTAAASKQHRDDFFLAASVPPSITWKSWANTFLQVFCTIKWRKKVPVNSGLLATAEHLCRAHECWRGAACLPLPKIVIRGAQILPAAWDCIRKEKTFLGFAGRSLPEHAWRTKAGCSRQRPCSPADHPPPPCPRSQPALVLPPVSSQHPSVAGDWEQFESQANINRSRFRKQE